MTCAGRWFSPVSSPIKLIHDITEILLKVALNTIATILTLLQIVTALFIYVFIYLFIHLFIVGFFLYDCDIVYQMQILEKIQSHRKQSRNKHILYFMGSFVHNIYIFYFLMLLFMNHCNDFAPCGPSIGQYKFFF